MSNNYGKIEKLRQKQKINWVDKYKLGFVIDSHGYLKKAKFVTQVKSP